MDGQGVPESVRGYQGGLGGAREDQEVPGSVRLCQGGSGGAQGSGAAKVPAGVASAGPGQCHSRCING